MLLYFFFFFERKENKIKQKTKETSIYIKVFFVNLVKTFPVSIIIPKNNKRKRKKEQRNKTKKTKNKMKRKRNRIITYM